MRLLKGLAAVLAVLLLSAAGFAYWQYRALLQFTNTPHAVPSDVVVEIPQGTGPRGVADRLAAAGAISDAERFYWNVRFLRKDSASLRAGEYPFSPDAPQSPNDIVDRLLKGEVRTTRVTVPEGLRLEEQAKILADAGVVDEAEFVKLARSADFAKSLGIEASTLEGYLYPTTYLIPRHLDTTGVVRLMVDHYRQAWAQAQKVRQSWVTLNEHEAVTLASIVEKETGRADERRHISCVFHNRLKKGMRLQTDPTVIYSVLMAQGTFDGNLRRVHLDTPHPYNTYSIRGLPPGPIANAGLAALEAALDPIECDDLFFVSRNDGSHVFCPTYACHNENVEKWQRQYFRNKRAEERRRAAQQGGSK